MTTKTQKITGANLEALKAAITLGCDAMMKQADDARALASDCERGCMKDDQQRLLKMAGEWDRKVTRLRAMAALMIFTDEIAVSYDGEDFEDSMLGPVEVQP